MAEKLDTSKLEPLNLSGLVPLNEEPKLDVSGLEPLDTSGLVPVEPSVVQPQLKGIGGGVRQLGQSLDADTPAVSYLSGLGKAFASSHFGKEMSSVNREFNDLVGAKAKLEADLATMDPNKVAPYDPTMNMPGSGGLFATLRPDPVSDYENKQSALAEINRRIAEITPQRDELEAAVARNAGRSEAYTQFQQANNKGDLAGSMAAVFGNYGRNIPDIGSQAFAESSIPMVKSMGVELLKLAGDAITAAPTFGIGPALIHGGGAAAQGAMAGRDATVGNQDQNFQEYLQSKGIDPKDEAAVIAFAQKDPAEYRRAWDLAAKTGLAAGAAEGVVTGGFDLIPGAAPLKVASKNKALQFLATKAAPFALNAAKEGTEEAVVSIASQIMDILAGSGKKFDYVAPVNAAVLGTTSGGTGDVVISGAGKAIKGTYSAVKGSPAAAAPAGAATAAPVAPTPVDIPPAEAAPIVPGAGVVPPAAPAAPVAPVAPETPAAPPVTEDSYKTPREGNVVVMVDPKKVLDAAAAYNPDRDIRNPENQLKRGEAPRVELAKKFLIDNAGKPQSLEASEVGINDDGGLGIHDGRHRMLAAEQLGIAQVGIEVKAEDAAKYDQFKAGEASVETSTAAEVTQAAQPAPAPQTAPAAPTAKPAPTSFIAGLREDAAKLRGQQPAQQAQVQQPAQQAQPAPSPAPQPAPQAQVNPTPSPQPTPAPGANRASFDPQADPRWQNLTRADQSDIRSLTAQRDKLTASRDNNSRRGKSNVQTLKQLSKVNEKIEKVLSYSQPPVAPAPRAPRVEATRPAPVEAAPKQEPSGIVKTRQEAAAIKEQITALEASGKGRTPQAQKLRAQFDLRKADLTSYEKKNGLPITYPPQPKAKPDANATPDTQAQVDPQADTRTQAEPQTNQDPVAEEDVLTEPEPVDVPSEVQDSGDPDEDKLRQNIAQKLNQLERDLEKYARGSRGLQSTIIPGANELIIATGRIALRLSKSKVGLDFLTATAGMAERYNLTPTQLKKAYEDAKGLLKQKSKETLAAIQDFVTSNSPGFKEGSLEISTRTPTKSGIENPLRTPVVVGLQSTIDSPKLLTRNANLIREYPNMRVVKGETEEQTVRRFVEHVKSNLLWLYNQVPANIRERSKLWYDGANKIANRWAEEYGHKPEAVAGVLAALSPQKDWYENVHLAEAVLKVWDEQQDNVASPQMLKALGKIGALSRFKSIAKVLANTKFKDLDVEKQALFTRLWSEAHTDRTHFIITPEGNFDGKVLNDDKVTEAKAGWLGLDHVEKAINCLRDQSVDNISIQMGDKHKVRNFYNNIIAPGSDMGHVTIDTHAVAAGLLRPLAGESLEVGHNLGSGYGFTENGEVKALPTVYQGRADLHPDFRGTPGTDATVGVNGTYGVFAEAYRQAAAEVGVLPREMQSITWEAIRGLFESGFKAQTKNVDAVDALWEKYRNGKLEIEQVRDQLRDLGGGITPPTWYKRGDQDAQGGRSSANPGELPGPGVSRSDSKPLDGGTRSRPASGNPKGVVTKDGDVANHGDADLASRGFISNEATKMPADLAGAKLVIEQAGDINENPNMQGMFNGKVMLAGRQIAEFTFDNASYSGEDNTKLDWIKIVPKHQNKGLSKVIQAEVIERAKRLNNPSQTYSMSVVDPKDRPTRGLQSLLGEENVRDNGPDYGESERGEPFAFKDPDTGEWITKTNEVTATIPNQYTAEERQLLADIKKEATSENPDPKRISEKLDEWAAKTLPKGQLLSVGPNHLAALVWQTARATQAGVVSFAQWSKQTIATYGPKIKPFLKQVWADSKQVRQNIYDFATIRYWASRADKMWQNAARNPQSKALVELANLLHPRDGAEATGELSSVPERIREERTKFANAWARILTSFGSEFSSMDKAQRQKWDEDFVEYVLGNKKPTDQKVAKAVAQYRQLMGELLAFQRDAGVEMGDRGGNYFPRVDSPEAVEADTPGFIAGAAEMYRMRDARLGNPDQGQAAYEQLAQQRAFRIMNGNVDQVQLNSAAVPDQSEMPSSTKAREFTDDEAELTSKFRSKDLDRVTLAYIGRATKAAEIARAFGPKGEKFTQLIAQLSKEKVPMDTIEETAGIVRRSLGYGIERHGKGAAKVLDWSNAMIASGYLGFSFINNILLEPISYGIRTGNPMLGLRAMAETWAGTIRVLSRADMLNGKVAQKVFGTKLAMAESFNEAMAEQLGLLHREMEHSFLDAHWNYTEENGSPLARWIIQRTQQANLMQQTEHAKVAASVGIARLALRDNVRFMMGKAPLQLFMKKLGIDATAPGSSSIILKENGVPEAEHQAFAKFVMDLEGKSDADYQSAIMANDRMAFLYRQAVQRMSNGMSIKANPALKMDSSDKLEGKMMMQLMNYSYAYANLVKDAMYSKAMTAIDPREKITKLDRMRLAVPLLVGGPLSIIAAEAGRQLIGALWPTEGTEKRDEQEDWMKALDSASYAGMFGKKFEFLAKIVARQQFPVGPGLDAAGKSVAAAAGIAYKDDNRAAKKQIYNAIEKPVVVGGSAAIHPFLGFMANQYMRQESTRDAFIGERQK